jgi:hypothetical protein
MNIAFSAVLKATKISHPMKVSPKFHIERKLEPSAVSCFIEYSQEKNEKIDLSLIQSRQHWCS